MAQAAICVGVADVRRESDAASELVTQALLGASAEPGAVRGGWQWVRLVDYAGWVRAEHVAAPPAAGRTGQVAVVIALEVPLFANSKTTDVSETLFLSTVLPLAEPAAEAISPTSSHERLAVALPGGKVGWVRAEDVALRPASSPFPRQDVPAVIATARRFWGTPYHWGGVTCRGIDCSGLVQVCYRMAGYVLPRDSYQQLAALSAEPEGEARAGDLLFFAKEGRVVHVALALGNRELIHAEGVTWNRVLHQSMDPGKADRYNHRLVELYCGSRRVIGVPEEAVQAISHSEGD